MTVIKLKFKVVPNPRYFRTKMTGREFVSHVLFCPMFVQRLVRVKP